MDNELGGPVVTVHTADLLFGVIVIAPAAILLIGTWLFGQ
jgi:hypothetical protein